MYITLLKSKIHRVVVTGSDKEYEGSLILDSNLMTAAEMVEYEKVDLWNVSNGERFSTYLIPGKQGEVIVNGAAAWRAKPGDKLIVSSFATIEREKVQNWTPTIVILDGENKISKIKSKNQKA
ncbi:MAG: aspartate 1-decarboxylase [Thaumarchaeota archaeon]|nr:aspartate 1-decarboxylase [Nitrososphaerota archaeon]